MLGQQHYDAVVAGGGLSGCAAAAQLAQQGCSVALLDTTAVLGWELVSARKIFIDIASMAPHASGAGEFNAKLRERHGQFAGAIDPVSAALALDDWLLSAGVDLLFHCWPSQVQLDSALRIVGLHAVSRTGRFTLETSAVIDATRRGKLARQHFAVQQPLVTPVRPTLALLFQGAAAWTGRREAEMTLTLNDGAACRAVVRPTFWPGEVQVEVGLECSGSELNQDEMGRRLATTYLFEIAEQLRRHVPVLANAFVCCTADEAWQWPDVIIQPSQAEPLQLENSEVVNGLVCAGPWLRRAYKPDLADQDMVLERFLLGAEAAAAVERRLVNRARMGELT